jgi:hypothetical protein
LGNRRRNIERICHKLFEAKTFKPRGFGRVSGGHFSKLNEESVEKLQHTILRLGEGADFIAPGPGIAE